MSDLFISLFGRYLRFLPMDSVSFYCVVADSAEEKRIALPRHFHSLIWYISTLFFTCFLTCFILSCSISSGTAVAYSAFSFTFLYFVSSIPGCLWFRRICVSGFFVFNSFCRSCECVLLPSWVSFSYIFFSISWHFVRVNEEWYRSNIPT
ncbi:hypothetical protein BJ742DRAFT_158382 [Cladochytrium replicatum]|nr:hypothetical protein BJ742DRAFT_158382 [Cladochytrium replicatum]